MYLHRLLREYATFLRRKYETPRRPALRWVKSSSSHTLIPRLDDHARGRFNPNHVIFDGSDTGDIFRSNFQRLTLALVDNHTPKFDHSVADNDIDHRRRRPALFLHL